MTQVLIIGYVWPEPNSSAAGSHMMSFIRTFREQGWQVTFASPAQPSDHMADLDSLQVPTVSILLNDSSFDEYISELQPDIVLFDRFMMEEQFGWRVEQQCPNAIRVLDTEDFHSLRQARHQAQKARRKVIASDLASEHAIREIAAIYRCDISLIISDHELALLTEYYGVPKQLLHYCPFMLDVDSASGPRFDDRIDFISIGNFRHAPNWDAVLYLKQNIWPKIRNKLPQANLNIYGAYPPKKATDLHKPADGFLVKGWADDAIDVMNAAKVCLAPLRFGAGIKGKLAEAMMCETPSVTTSIGAEGMLIDSGWSGAVEDDIDDFVDAAVRLYQDQSSWQSAVNQGHLILKQRFDRVTLAASLLARIEQCRDNLEQERLANFTGLMLRHHSHKSTKFMAQWIESKNALQSIKNNQQDPQ